MIKIFDSIDSVYDQYIKRVPTSTMNRLLFEITAKLTPPRHRNRPNKISYATQTSVKPPTFVFFVREPKAIHFSYERYLANRIREELGFDQVPIRLFFRKKNN